MGQTARLPEPGPAFRDMRERAQLTQAAAAERSGVSLWTIRRCERVGGIVSPAARRLVASALRLEAELLALNADDGGGRT
jgi:hypothetical protein